MPDGVFEQCRVMACSHAEFRHSLARFRPDLDWREEPGPRFVAEDAPRHMEIGLGPEGVRRIAMLALPQTEVTLRLSGFGDDELAAFLRRFDIAFQRGGG